MNFRISKLLILISLFATIISSCKKDDEEENDFFESYRYELWKNLVDNNYNFDFVGRQKDYGTYEEYLVKNLTMIMKGLEVMNLKMYLLI